MKVAQIKSAPQFQSSYWQQYGIQTYGETNDFPQSVDEIIKASETGRSCLDIYNNFVYGHGFKDPSIYKLVVNNKQQKLDKVLRLVVKDFTEWYGFAIHVNYNQNYKVSSIAYQPFENCRLERADDDGFVGRIAVHSDWGHRDKTRYRWTPSDIEWFDAFNPDPAAIDAQVQKAGGWDEWKGQIYYFSGDAEGDLVYPVPTYVAEMTDMRTEEGLANVTGRNVCSNFLLAGILADIMEEEQSDEQVNAKQLELMKFQGDESALQLWYTQVKNKDQVPVFVPFSGENYDKAFTSTQAVIPDNIGRAFKQPPILRAVDVGANFGADLMTNAYVFYNSITARERMQISEVFADIFKYWWAGLDNPDFTIQALTYSAGDSIYERVGKDAMTQILGVMENDKFTLTQKRNTLKLGYGLYDEEVTKLLPNTAIQGGGGAGIIGSIGVGGLDALLVMLQNQSMPSDIKASTLQIVFGLSENDANLLVNQNDT